MLTKLILFYNINFKDFNFLNYKAILNYFFVNYVMI